MSHNKLLTKLKISHTSTGNHITDNFPQDQLPSFPSWRSSCLWPKSQHGFSEWTASDRHEHKISWLSSGKWILQECHACLAALCHWSLPQRVKIHVNSYVHHKHHTSHYSMCHCDLMLTSGLTSVALMLVVAR